MPKELRNPNIEGLQRQTQDDVRRAFSSGTIELVLEGVREEASSPLSKETSTKTTTSQKTQSFELSPNPKASYNKQFTVTDVVSPRNGEEMKDIHWVAVPSVYGEEWVFKSTTMHELRDFINQIHLKLIAEIEEYCFINKTRPISNAESKFMLKRITYRDVDNNQIVSVNKLTHLIAYSTYHSSQPLQIEWHLETPIRAEFVYLNCLPR